MKNVNIIENQIVEFLVDCKTEGKSPHTIHWYGDFLECFNKFLVERKLPTETGQIDKVAIRAFIRYLQAEHRTPKGKLLADASVQGYVRTLKAFFAWVKREDYREDNPMSGIPVPKARVKLINTFSQDEIDRLFNQCRFGQMAQRDQTVFLLLLDTGLRVSELTSIDIEDVNMNEGYIKINIAKGNKERVVPIGSLVQKSLWKYINSHRPEPLTRQIHRLFLNRNGTPFSKNGLQQMLRRNGRAAGLKGVRCSPHTLRHTFARNYLLNGGDIFSLQKILGHSSLASVRIYLNLFGTDIKKQHERFSPVDNLATEVNSLKRRFAYQVNR